MVHDLRMNVFLSHASPDKPLVRRLGVELQLVGADLFFDEWSNAVRALLDLAERHPGEALSEREAFLAMTEFVWQYARRMGQLA